VKEGNHDQFEFYRRRDGDTCTHGDDRPIRSGRSVLLQAAAPTEEQQEQETMHQEAEDRPKISA
jgi:hypothetical protein